MGGGGDKNDVSMKFDGAGNGGRDGRREKEKAEEWREIWRERKRGIGEGRERR